MQAIQGVSVPVIEIERTGAERVVEAAGQARRHVEAVLLQLERRHSRRRIPVRQLALVSDIGNAVPCVTGGANANAIADRLAVSQYVVKEFRTGLDDDRAG